MLLDNLITQNICIISSFVKSDNIFEVESYFHRVLEELGIEWPNFETCLKSYIMYLSQKIINNEEDIFDLAYAIYRIVAELDYPEELIEWYEISEMIDAVNYQTFYTSYFTKEEVEEKIVRQAKLQTES